MQCLFLKDLGKHPCLKAGRREERMGFVVSIRPPSFVPALSCRRILHFQNVEGSK